MYTLAELIRVIQAVHEVIGEHGSYEFCAGFSRRRDYVEAALRRELGLCGLGGDALLYRRMPETKMGPEAQVAFKELVEWLRPQHTRFHSLPYKAIP